MANILSSLQILLFHPRYPLGLKKAAVANWLGYLSQYPQLVAMGLWA
jgi:hypothetical protein